MFVESDGTPVLQVVCGNPLILGPKKPVTPNPVVTTTGQVEGTKEIAVEAPPAVSAVAPTPETPEVGKPIEPIYPAAHSNSNPVAMLLGLAGAVGFFPHHHSPPVPEPMSFIAMAGGLAALALRRRAKKA